MRLILAAVLTLAAAAPAYAQYYAPPRYYLGPGYGPGYGPRYGRHCEAFAPSAYGPQRVYCPIVDAKPLGEDCACPPPRPPPGYAPGPYVGGRTVR